jgi:two-component system phosphate regulon sensor histidine kinase PhoR
LESLGEGVIAVDAGMRVTYVNYMGSRMLGISRRSLLGQTFPLSFEQANPLLLSRCSQLLSRCQSQNSILTDFLSFADDRKTYIDLIAAPKAKGSGAIIVLQDKSSHYKVIEMGKDFVANASHELRTPITIIKGFAETLQDLPHMSKEMFKEIIEKIVRNCERMEKLIKNLLTLADIENIAESRFKETNLGLLLDNCLHTLLSVYPNAQVAITKPGKEIFISADSDILELALINLLDNAAKYSGEPAQIAISLESLDLEEVRIVITDKGIGIPPQDIEHIFERFYTVDKAHSRKLGGAGLGLSIVRTIIEKHDGRISVKSTLGVGTTFTIVLPKQRRAKA